MKHQRITTNPLARITAPQRPGEGIPSIWDDAVRGETLPNLPTGQAWVPIEAQPPYDPDAQRIERSLTAQADGWQIVDLTDAEIEAQVAREASTSEARAQSIAQQKVAEAKKAEERTRVLTLSDADALNEPPELFPPFEIGKAYEVGDRFSWRGTLYKVRQAHTSAVEWLPSQNLALYNVVSLSTEWEAGVAYETGDERTYDGILYRALSAHTSQVGWEPPNVPALWEVVV